MARALLRPPGLLLVLSIVLALAVPAHADIAPLWTDRQLTDMSDAVLTGRVIHVESAWGPRGYEIYTYVTLELGEVAKGWIPERQITLKLLGGQVDGRVSWYGGQAEFYVGEEVLVFLSARDRERTLYPTAMWQGKWTVERDEAGAPLASRPYFPREDMGALATDREYRLLGTFLTEIRAWAGPESRQPTALALTVHPSEAPAIPDVPEETSEEVTAEFNFLGSIPARWMETDGSDMKNVPVDKGGSQPGLAGGGTQELRNGLKLWTNAGSSFHWRSRGATGQRCHADRTPGSAYIGYMNQCNEVPNGALASGGYSSTNATQKVVNDTDFWRAYQGSVVMSKNPAHDTWLKDSRCHQDIVTHEFGHVLGLGHESGNNIMNPTIDNACIAALQPGRETTDAITGGLSADDINGIRFIYPKEGSVTVPGAPENFTATFEKAGKLTLDWDAPGSGGDPTSYVIRAGSTEGATNLANFDTKNTKTQFVRNGPIPNKVCIRIHGKNAAGVGAASDEECVTSNGGGGPPGAPEKLEGNFDGNKIEIDWDPPSTGGKPTNYIIEVGTAPGKSNVLKKTVPAAVTSASGKAPKGKTFFIRIRAKNGSGTSGPSNEERIDT